MLHDTELSRSSFRPPRTALAIFLWHSGCCISHGTFQRVFNKPALGLAESPDQLQAAVSQLPLAQNAAQQFQDFRFCHALREMLVLHNFLLPPQEWADNTRAPLAEI